MGRISPLRQAAGAWKGRAPCGRGGGWSVGTIEICLVTRIGFKKVGEEGVVECGERAVGVGDGESDSG